MDAWLNGGMENELGAVAGSLKNERICIFQKTGINKTFPFHYNPLNFLNSTA